MDLKKVIMEKAVQLKVRKDLDSSQQLNIIKLKGSLIAKGYTQIIHILDQDDEFHINSFQTPAAYRNEVHAFITAFISKENLEDVITLYR
jgi:hypothetical protein